MEVIRNYDTFYKGNLWLKIYNKFKTSKIDLSLDDINLLNEKIFNYKKSILDC